MKKRVAIIFLIFISIRSFSQKIDSLENRIKYYESIVKNAKDSIQFLRESITDYNKNLKFDSTQKSYNIRTVVLQGWYHLEKPHYLSKRIGYLISGTPIVITGYAIEPERDGTAYYKLSDGTYFRCVDVKLTDSLVPLKNLIDSEVLKMNNRFIKKYEVSKTEDEKKRKLTKTEEDKNDSTRKAILIKQFGKINGMKLFNRVIWIGMTSEMLKVLYGKPDDINRSVYSFGVHEQWIYKKINKDEYYYFENNILKSWQD